MHPSRGICAQAKAGHLKTLSLPVIQHCRVLPTSSEDGLIECVPSVALARVLADHKTINRFFAINNADPAGEGPEPFQSLQAAQMRVAFDQAFLVYVIRDCKGQIPLSLNGHPFCFYERTPL